MSILPNSLDDASRDHLRADCDNCFGLCCVALRFLASDGFPTDKEAGQPCVNLQNDFRCGVHESLRTRGLKGCSAFDCFGAGQKVSQVSFSGHDWQQSPGSGKPMFEVFQILMQLQELLWYLTEALTLPQAELIHGPLRSMLEKTERLTTLSPESLMELDVAEHRASVNTLLLKTSELVRSEARKTQQVRSGPRTRTRLERQIGLGRGADLMGADLRRTDLTGASLRGAYLIAADLRGTDMRGTDCIGADFRGADVRGADLSQSLFLTQTQLNAAMGDAHTKLPPWLNRPAHWS